MPDITVTSRVLDAIAAAARQAAPDEACGLLLGRAGLIAEARPTANIAPDPRRHFEIDAAALIAAHRAEREGGAELIGYFHSHPAGPARPSPTDQDRAARDGRIWAIAGADGTIGWFVSAAEGLKPFEPRIDH